MIQRKEVGDEAKHWYILDKDGDVAIRIKSGIKLGELTDGQLALADSTKANQWIRLYVNADDELWLTVIHSEYVLQTDEHVKVQHFRLKAGAQIQLPNNNFTISDHPFLCEPDKLVIRVRTQENAVALTPTRELCKSQIAKNKILADIDTIVASGFTNGKANNARPANDVIRAEPSLAIETTGRSALQAKTSAGQYSAKQNNPRSWVLPIVSFLVFGVCVYLLQRYSGYQLPF